MRFSLIHIDEGSDELTVVVPGGERAAIMVPLDALPAFLPILDEAIETLPEQCCAACDEPLPGLRREADAR
ncbi:MAG: hypothetical protein QOI80_3348 [Solirubrobacteraceae bacterium]|jgi:hypothetical protein|nr:hypothetical protein [Solirubrobacteraceae bacterium]